MSIYMACRLCGENAAVNAPPLLAKVNKTPSMVCCQCAIDYSLEVIDDETSDKNKIVWA